MKYAFLFIFLFCLRCLPAFTQASDNVINTENTDTLVAPEVPAKFPGGERARMIFLAQHIKYPPEARAKKIEGTVYVTFIIEPDGLLSNINLESGIGGGCDEEALRVVYLMPNWIPGKQNGKNVRVFFRMPIRFVL